MENLGLGKVLLVEDDEKLAGLVSHFLSQHGFEVRVVYRGDEALAAVVECKPKIVGRDLMLPGQSGLHGCREIR
ncbi:response regulator, partial [Pseudomonas aeruginosa]|uniref:response regulator n=1 Tax=Pseudomonas aeruginosa TaxID=287 RepID=UPI000B729076